MTKIKIGIAEIREKEHSSEGMSKINTLKKVKVVRMGFNWWYTPAMRRV